MKWRLTVSGKLGLVLGILGVSLALPRSAHAACADGTWDADSEACDDGNAQPGDGCDSECQLECSAVNLDATDHTCTHGAFGPFESAAAQEYPGFIYTEVNSPHTYYTVTLPVTAGAANSAVLFWPVATGPVAIYTKTQFPLVVRAAAGNAVPTALEHAITTCSVEDSLTWVRAFRELTDAEPYTLDIGPTAEGSVSLAIEYLSAFRLPWFRDADQDGWGGALVTESWCQAPVSFASQGDDCDDAAPEVHPEATETCNGVDDDCDSTADVESEGLCSSSESGSACLDTREGVRCGCAVTSECTGGRSCDLQTGECVAFEPGGDGGAGGEASEGGAASGGPSAGGTSTEAGASPTGEVPSGAGDANPGGAYHVGGAVTGGGGASSGRTRPEGDSGCRYGAGAGASSSTSLLLMLAALRRRRRRVHAG